MDISHCGIAEVSHVFTWMTCNDNCWTVNGSDKIYNLSNDGFRVYLKQKFDHKSGPLRAHFAKAKNYELHYEVKGICNDISGSV